MVTEVFLNFEEPLLSQKQEVNFRKRRDKKKEFIFTFTFQYSLQLSYFAEVVVEGDII